MGLLGQSLFGWPAGWRGSRWQLASQPALSTATCDKRPIAVADPSADGIPQDVRAKRARSTDWAEPEYVWHGVVCTEHGDTGGGTGHGSSDSGKTDSGFKFS